MSSIRGAQPVRGRAHPVRLIVNWCFIFVLILAAGVAGWEARESPIFRARSMMPEAVASRGDACPRPTRAFRRRTGREKAWVPAWNAEC